MKTIMSIAVIMGSLMLLAAVASAHGGRFPGTAGVGSAGGFVPAGTGTPSPSPGPGPAGGGSTPSPTTGGTTTGGISTPAPTAGPVRPGGVPTGGGGLPVGGGFTGAIKKRRSDAGTSWAAWWFFNDDRFLNLKAKVRSQEQDTDTSDLFMSPGASDTIVKVPAKKIREKVNPALEYALGDDFFDTRAAAAIALGKTGFPENIAHILKAVSDDDHRVRESACLGLGILGNKEAVPFLIHVMQNTREAKKALGRGTGDVLTRTRAFAALGLGLIGDRTDISGTQAVSALIDMIKNNENGSRDLQVAPLTALGLMRATEAVPFLIDFAKDQENGAWQRAYAITALSKIGDQAAKDVLVKGLRDKQNAVVQSSAMGLGLLTPADDKKTIAALQRTVRRGRDLAAKNFAIISLGQIGGVSNRNFLVRLVKKGNKFEKTFGALALAVYFNNQKNAGDPERRDVAKMLHKAFNGAKDPIERGAYAISLGIMGYDTAAPDILKTLLKGGQASMRAHLCVALGLMRYEKSTKDIQDIVKEKGDVDLRRNAAIALGLMGDKGAVDELKKEIQDSANSQAVQGAVVQGLGFIGDVSAVDTLVQMVKERSKFKDVTRAFAAVALGLLGDKDSISVIDHIAENSNYIIRTDAIGEVLTIL
ncbi:MAG TPA: HEAT repeat domain-containing protein [Planctomycetes bacterium]|nr:HEAT repeat domain-containing protein [Planctomycetota bacterium]